MGEKDGFVLNRLEQNCLLSFRSKKIVHLSCEYKKSLIMKKLTPPPEYLMVRPSCLYYLKYYGSHPVYYPVLRKKFNRNYNVPVCLFFRKNLVIVLSLGLFLDQTVQILIAMGLTSKIFRQN